MDELQKSLRNQYSNDNEAYKAALKEKGITPVNSTGKVRGIQQAYYDGTIDKGTRDYMMADAIAKFARNIGRDIGNIGAQFTGGTVNNNFETSNWDKRNEELFKQQTSAEAASIENSDKGREATGQNLANEKSEHALEASRTFERRRNEALEKAKKLRDEGNKAGAAIVEGYADVLSLVETSSTGDIGTDEYIVSVVGSLVSAYLNGDITEKDVVKSIKAAGNRLGGMGGTIIKTLGLNSDEKDEEELEAEKQRKTIEKYAKDLKIADAYNLTDEEIKYLKGWAPEDHKAREILKANGLDYEKLIAADYAAEFGIDINNISEEQKLMLTEMANKKGWSAFWSQDDEKAKAILDQYGQ